MLSTTHPVMVVVILTALAANGLATVIVEVQPASSEVTVGQPFSMTLVATIPDPVLGWGLDLTYDHAVLSMVGTPTIGPLWLPATASDGDGLAGLAFPTSISGTNVLLATVTFLPTTAGQTDLTLSVTPGDLSEGFPLDPTGFADLDLHSAHVTATPEPAGIILLALAGGLVMRRGYR